MNRTIADMIRELYFSRTMKQTELANLFRLSQGNVSRIISGEIWNA